LWHAGGTADENQTEGKQEEQIEQSSSSCCPIDGASSSMEIAHMPI
jgi:hypothetical protein